MKQTLILTIVLLITMQQVIGSAAVTASAGMVAANAARANRERQETQELRTICEPPKNFSTQHNCELIPYDRSIKNYNCKNQTGTWNIEAYCNGEVYKQTYQPNNNTTTTILDTMILLLSIGILFMGFMIGLTTN